MGAVARRGEQTCLVKFLPLTHLYVPAGPERHVKLDLYRRQLLKDQIKFLSEGVVVGWLNRIGVNSSIPPEVFE